MASNQEFQDLAARVNAVEETLRKEPAPTIADIDRMQRELLAVIDTLDQWLLPPDPYASTALRPGLNFDVQGEHALSRADRIERDLATTMFDANGPTGLVYHGEGEEGLRRAEAAAQDRIDGDLATGGSDHV